MTLLNVVLNVVPMGVRCLVAPVDIRWTTRRLRKRSGLATPTRSISPSPVLPSSRRTPLSLPMERTVLLSRRTRCVYSCLLNSDDTKSHRLLAWVCLRSRRFGFGVCSDCCHTIHFWDWCPAYWWRLPRSFLSALEGHLLARSVVGQPYAYLP